MLINKIGNNALMAMVLTNSGYGYPKKEYHVHLYRDQDEDECPSFTYDQIDEAIAVLVSTKKIIEEDMAQVDKEKENLEEVNKFKAQNEKNETTSELDIPKAPLNKIAIPHGEGVNGNCPNCGKIVNCYSQSEKCSCNQKLLWR